MIAPSPTRAAITLLVVACLQVAVASESFASLPVLKQVLPRGVQRGTQHKLTFTGLRLEDAEQVFFYDEGFDVVDLRVISDEKLEVTVKVAPECRLGEHMVQIRTRTGISGYRIIQVEAYPSVAEDNIANDDRTTAQLIIPKVYSEEFPKGVGIVVAGRIQNEDHDWYSFEGIEGERLSVEVVGMRLGDFCDIVLELFEPSGKRIAYVDDTPFSKQDPFVSISLPADGRYLIHLADSAGKGDDNAWYRMHVGNFPRPTTAVPAVVNRNDLSEVTFFGDASGPIQETLKLDKPDLYQDSIHVVDQLGSTPTPVFIRVVDPEFEAVREKEPNNKYKTLTRKFSIPFSVSGKIDSQQDRDIFRFDAVKDQRVRIETFGYRIGSAIDTTIRVRGAKNQVVRTNTDTDGSDSRVVVTIPADGSYTVEVLNADRGFGPMTRYQLDVQLEQPAFNFAIKETEKYTQQRQQIAVPAGNRFAILLTAERTEFDAPFRLIADQLPESIRMFARPMPAGATTMPVVFEAAPFNEKADGSQKPTSMENEDSLRGQLIELTAQSIDDTQSDSSTPVIGRYLNRAQLMRIKPGNMCMKFGVVNKLAVARLDPVPFKIDLVQPKGPISQNGRMNLRINVTRDKGFTQPIILRLPFRPPGISAAPTVRLNRNQTAVDYPINANNKAAVDLWPICVTAVSPNDQGSKISTGLHDLKIVTPFVSIKGDMVSTEAGSQVMAKCRVETLKQFKGTAKVKLTQLPAHVTSEPRTFSASRKTIQFPIKVGPNCATKKNHRVQIEVTVNQSGHPIVFDAGHLLMRFSPASKREIKSSRRQPVRTQKPSRGQQ